MDINAACAGFMYALVTAGQFVNSGASTCALVVGAEVMSRTINPADKKTYPLFGDGAGAVLLRPTKDLTKGLLSYTLGRKVAADKCFAFLAVEVASRSAPRHWLPEIITCAWRAVRC